MFIYQKKYPNIWYVDDNGGIYTIGGYNILFIPGAYSVDKYYRLAAGYPWNPNEQMDTKTFTEFYDMVKEWINLGFSIDFVIGHTVPLNMETYYNDLFMDIIDQKTVDKSTEEWLQTIADKLDFNKWYFGHFHGDWINDKYEMLYSSIKEF